MFPLFMLLAGAVTLSLAVFVALRGCKVSTRAFALLMAAAAEWLICMAGWALSPTPQQAMVWFWLQFIGVCAIPVLLLAYVQTFSRRAPARPLSGHWLLWIVPGVTQILAWTNSGHQLMFRSVGFTRADDVTVLSSWSPGPWFLLHTTYSFTLVTIAIVLIVRMTLGSDGIFRRQLLLLLVALAPPVLLTVLNTLQLLPPDQLTTPLGFVLTGAIMAVAIIRYQMTSVAPIARELMIEQLDDGMLVIDERERIIDLNPTMQAMIAHTRGQLLSQPLARALAHRPDLYTGIVAAHTAPTEIAIGPGPAVQHYDITIRPLLERDRPLGRLVVLRNITRLKVIQSELFTLATTDMLTGLYNRRQFTLLAQAQIELAGRNGRPLALMLVDVDRFKQINDTYGHAIGDEVLRGVAATTRATLRAADIICRYGGEEFVVLLPEAGLKEAHQAAERLRLAIAAGSIPTAVAAISPTVSVGLALRDPAGAADLDLLLRQADAAMYHAKQAGRNRVTVYAPTFVERTS